MNITEIKLPVNNLDNFKVVDSGLAESDRMYYANERNIQDLYLYYYPKGELRFFHVNQNRNYAREGIMVIIENFNK